MKASYIEKRIKKLSSVLASVKLFTQILVYVHDYYWYTFINIIHVHDVLFEDMTLALEWSTAGQSGQPELYEVKYMTETVGSCYICRYDPCSGGIYRRPVRRAHVLWGGVVYSIDGCSGYSIATRTTWLLYTQLWQVKRVHPRAYATAGTAAQTTLQFHCRLQWKSGCHGNYLFFISTPFSGSYFLHCTCRLS